VKARVQRHDIREQPIAIPDITSLVVYDNQGQAMFVLYEDFGGVIQYASTADSDFEDIHTLASGGPSANSASISNLNLKKN
tara:strand:+ start:321 stop:563 length:243 start_codon:yes stop_codon:yes gene_type:complete